MRVKSLFATGEFSRALFDWVFMLHGDDDVNEKICASDGDVSRWENFKLRIAQKFRKKKNSSPRHLND